MITNLRILRRGALNADSKKDKNCVTAHLDPVTVQQKKAWLLVVERYVMKVRMSSVLTCRMKNGYEFSSDVKTNSK